MPHSCNPETECFNPIVDKLGLPEILGANIHEKNYRWPWLNKERAYVQLVSKLLGVEFDAIWQRHKRLLRQKLTAWAVGVLLVIAALIGVWMNSQPVDVEVRLNELSVHNDDLPPLKDAVVTMSLDNETKTDTVSSLSDAITFTNVPHRFLGKKVRVEITARDFLPLDTVVVLSEQVALGVHRNPQIYGDVHFRIWDGNKEGFVSGATIELEGQTLTSDSDGWIRFSVPMASQKTTYELSSSVPLENSWISMPCGPDDVVTVKASK